MCSQPDSKAINTALCREIVAAYREYYADVAFYMPEDLSDEAWQEDFCNLVKRVLARRSELLRDIDPKAASWKAGA